MARSSLNKGRGRERLELAGRGAGPQPRWPRRACLWAGGRAGATRSERGGSARPAPDGKGRLALDERADETDAGVNEGARSGDDIVRVGQLALAELVRRAGLEPAAWLEWRSLGDSIGVARVTISAVALVCLALAACGGGGGGGDKTFEGDGFSFTYPEDWEESDFDVQFGEQATTAALSPEAGANILLVGAGRQNVPVTEENIDGLSDAFAAQVDQEARKLRGKVTSGPSRMTVGGLPALSFEVSAVNQSGTHTQSQLLLIFDGRTQYFLNCQYTPSGADEMKQGCDQAVESFQAE